MSARHWCTKLCILAATTIVALNGALQMQLLRDGSRPNLSPNLLKGEFHQQGSEFATVGPHWRNYVNRGGFPAQCADAGAACQATLHLTQRRQWRIEAKETARLVLPLFAFAGWAVKLDGASVPFSIDPDTGLVAIPVPAGPHVIDVEFRGLPEARIGKWISIVSGFALLLLLIRSRRLHRRTAGDLGTEH
jgi:hypothetical protein